MNDSEDTIAAISTPSGPGGIAIVRISGAEALSSADRIFVPKKKRRPSSSPSHRVLYGHVLDPGTGRMVDEALLTIMKKPNTYTREDVVEISCHGGMVPARRTLEIVLEQGVRLAHAGEFTRRAFMNGRIDLSQAEAVMDVINAKTWEGMKLAEMQLRGGLTERLNRIRQELVDISAYVEAYIDFPEDEIGIAEKDDMGKRLADAIEEIRRLSGTFDGARFFRDGLAVAIVGRPNVGKSSLLNRLLQKERAIVTDQPGTTRDLIEDYIDIKGLPVRIIDTAGIRHSEEAVEKEGVRRSRQAIEDANFVIAMFDGSEDLRQEDRDIITMVSEKKAVMVMNKADLPARFDPEDLIAGERDCLRISTVTGEGIEELRNAVFESNIHGWQEEQEGVVVTSLRHKKALDNAAEALARAAVLLAAGQPAELFSIEMREALDRVGGITGAVTTDEILDRIFSSFCIGK